MFKNTLAVIAGGFLALTSAHLAAAELNASAGVASTYIFRGVDVAQGSPQVYGDLSASSDLGLYGGIWGSNAGDAGAEYDLNIGWNFNVSDTASLNIGIVNYVYPNDTGADDLFAEAEAYLGYANGGFEVFAYKNIASKHWDNNDYYYLASSYTYRSISFTLGYADDNDVAGVVGAGSEGKYKYFHLDFTYAFNDNLAFTFSQIVNRKAYVNGNKLSNAELNQGIYSSIADDDLQFVVTYSLPLAF